MLARRRLAAAKLTKRKRAPTSVPFFMTFTQWLFLASKPSIVVLACLAPSVVVLAGANVESSQPRHIKQLPDCLSRLHREAVNVARVTDGDTLVLSDKRRIRLIGINTLELNEKNSDDRFWANTASDALELFIGTGAVSIVPGIETHDRHGRVLAYLIRGDGLDASHELVRQGLAFAVAVGKNTRCANELHAIEKNARQGASGLWRTPGKWQLTQTRLSGRERGFRVVHGQVMQLKGRGKRRTLILDNGLIAQLGKHWPQSDKTAQKTLGTIVGQSVKLRGWLGGSTGNTYLTINHPANLEVTSR